MKLLKPLTWHPFRSNPLDFVGRKDLLFDAQKETVLITQNIRGDFFVNGKLTGSNMSTCHKLDEIKAGYLCNI